MMLEQHPHFQKAKTVLLYHSLPDEVNTHAFIERWSLQKQLLLPVVKGDELELRFYKPSDELKVGSYHIMEPEGDKLTDYSQIDLAVIPGVAFDAQGHRLGRGKGYYDRLLPQLNCFKIGICFPFQIVEEVPTDIYDVKMDEVISLSL